jgi:hypothetical protein
MEHFRPYSIVCQLDTTLTSSIELKDSAGEPLDCNYVFFDMSADIVQARIGLIASASYDANTTTDSSELSLGSTSGTVSVVLGNFTKGGANLLISDKDRVNKINVGKNIAGPVNFFITYGQVKKGSPLRQNQRPVGN